MSRAVSTPARCRQARRRAPTALALVLVAGAGAAVASPQDLPAPRGRERLAGLWDRITALLAEASAARAPARVPPEPLAVRWQARRVSSISLDAPLLALAAADLDGDGRDELAALTSDELVVLALDGAGFAVRARAPMPAEPAAIRPRAPVGTLVAADTDGDGRAELAARSSAQARGAVFVLADGALRERARMDGFPLCAGVAARLIPGRNYFDGQAPAMPVPHAGPVQAPGDAPASPSPDARLLPPWPARFSSARCRDRLVDPAGRPLQAAGVVATDGVLTLVRRVQCAASDSDCPAPGQGRHTGAGVAFDIADIDRDGHPEIAVTRASAPGDPDEVEVLTWASDGLQSRFRRRFTGGVVGLASGDFDGDRAPVLIGAVRLLGSHRVDLWSFNDT